MKFSLFTFLLSTVLYFNTIAQPVLPSAQAYEKAQAGRAEARRYWQKDKATPADYTAALVILNKTLDYLHNTEIEDLAQGDIYLKGRKHDVYLDLLMVNTLAKKYDDALTALEHMSEQGSYYFISMLEQDSVFIPLRTSPRYQSVINTLKLRQALWKDEAMQTPYHSNLSDEEKLAGLSLLWSQAKYSFANFDHANINWDKTYLDYIMQVKNTSSTADYYKVLQKFYAQLKDGHTNVYFPKELNEEMYSRPPMRTELIEGKIFITQVFSDSLIKAGIAQGTEIVSIDGVPVINYGKTNIMPYQSSSTPQDLDIRTYSYGLLSGPANRPLQLQLRSSKGKVWNQAVARTGYHDVRSTPGFTYREIGKVGYLVINNFEDDKIMKQFDSVFTHISSTKGLVIDIRNNGGGNSYIGYHILAALTNKPFKTSYSKVARFMPLIQGIQWQENAPEDWAADGKQLYNKPVVVLISARTFSAAEDFTVAFDYMKRGKLIGQATGGSTGQPMNFKLPGGGSARICSKHDAYPDGKEFIGIGIIPDIQVTKAIKDVEAGRDAALQQALKLLN